MTMYKKVSAEYLSIFDPNTGQGIRVKRDKVSGKLLQDDPFMADFPELLDVGIMGHCKHGKSGLCQKAGIGCYQNGLTRNMPPIFHVWQKNARAKHFNLLLVAAATPMNMNILRTF